MRFSEYLNEHSESDKDVKRTLGKLPSKHAGLVRGYKVVFQPSNSLKGDEKHIGVIDEKKKTITISSPWHYGREYTFLHEVGHAVWKYLVDEDKKAEWKKILGVVKKNNKKDLNQNDEEIFCMTYAQYYSKNKMKKYDHDRLVDFVSKL
jgi:hypothetical protein